MKKQHWPRLRKSVQVISLLIFIMFFASSHARDMGQAWGNFFFRLDPLTAITAMLAGRKWIPVFSFALITLIITLVFGRVWCGWICPMGTLLDWISPRKSRRITRELSPGWRAIKYILLAVMILGALFSVQSLVFLDPITIVTRTLSTSIWPGLHYMINAGESALYQFEFLWEGLDIFHENVTLPLFRGVETFSWTAVPVFLFFASLFALNWVAERFWCRYLCPLGGLLGLLSRFSFLRREVSQDCISCEQCVRVCPTATIDARDAFKSDPAECVVCLDCLDTCKPGANTFEWQLSGYQVGGGRSYDPGRRTLLISAGAAIGTAALSGIEANKKRQPARLLRPPGSISSEFESLCIRCGACINVCPTQGLQTTGLEGGWMNIMTPGLVPRLGACAYQCNACSVICPSGAIPALTLTEKQETVIGLASVNRNRCLPWAYDTPCIICEEACPLPEKAIVLDEEIILTEEGNEILLQKPVVNRHVCIGCGVCEHQCPMGGDAAIQVFSPTNLDDFWWGF